MGLSIWIVLFYFTMLFDFDYKIDVPLSEVGEKDKYLDEIISDDIYERMFSGRQISFLNKTRCGNGGTTGFINYALKNDKGCLVLVPNRSICISKEEYYKDNDEVCCVYGGCKSFNRDARIVIATYDKFDSLLKELSQGGFCGNDIFSDRFWGGRTIIIDEYHKLIDECSFRDVCSDVPLLIKETDSSVILMSATMHEGFISFIRDLVPDKKIGTYTVVYNDGWKRCIQMYSIPKRKVLCDILKKIKDSLKEGQHMCVFLNCVDYIKKIINQIGADDVEVLCSEKNKDDLEKYYSNKFDETKKLHFMTSAYFTGHDISVSVKHCIIIGSPGANHMCLGERDIKQIIGRFRYSEDDKRKVYGGAESIHIFYLKEKLRGDEYVPYKDLYDKYNSFLTAMGDNWVSDKNTIKLKQETIMLADTLERFDYWSSIDKLKKRLEDYGYSIIDSKLKEFEEIVRRKKLTFKQAKKMIAEDKPVSYDDYPYCSQIRQYLESKNNNKDLMLKATLSTIRNFCKIKKNVGISKLDVLTPEEKFKAMGLSDFCRYRASFLMDCLKYLKVKCGYDELSYTILEELGCYAVRLKLDPKGNPQGDICMVMLPPMWKDKSDSEISDDDDLPVSEYRISYQIDTNDKNKRGIWAKTMPLMKAGKGYFKSLTGIPLYDWVCEDKKNRLPGEKETKDWQKIKHYGQTQISELYKDTDEEYPFKKSSMEAIDCLIVDIDSGLTFSQFKKRYSRWFWAAYPTINNTEEDWKKFRVIVPLRKTLKISGEHSLAVVKLLRNMFCYFEDPCHQVFSYVNSEDWSKGVKNYGERFYIPQDVVDYILLNIKKQKEFSLNKIDEKKKEDVEKGIEKIRFQWTFNKAKEVFLRALEEKKEGKGNRNNTLFIIKNRLNEEDREQFEGWLARTQDSKYVREWRGNHLWER